MKHTPRPGSAGLCGEELGTQIPNPKPKPQTPNPNPNPKPKPQNQTPNPSPKPQNQTPIPKSKPQTQTPNPTPQTPHRSHPNQQTPKQKSTRTPSTPLPGGPREGHGGQGGYPPGCAWCSSTVKVPVFAALQLARCAFPGRAWRLRAAWYSQSEAPATRRPATAAGARASRLQRRRVRWLCHCRWWRSSCRARSSSG